MDHKEGLHPPKRAERKGKPKRTVRFLKSKQSGRVVPDERYTNDGTGIKRKAGPKVRQTKKQRRANRAKLREHGFKEAKK